MTVGFKRKAELKKKDIFLFLILTGLMCLWGGIYDFSAALYGVVFCISVFLILKKRKVLKFHETSQRRGC